jgi:response regulator NasT
MDCPQCRLLQSQLERTEARLEERRIVDRAKCLLMERDALSEADAYGRLRRLAMARSQRIVDIAHLVLAQKAAA